MWYVVDGVDGSGKSSVAEYLAEKLRSEGRKVLVLSHPNLNTCVGRKEAEFLTQEGGYAKIMATLLYIFDVARSIRCKKRNDRKKEYDDIIFVRYIMAVAYVPEPLSKIAYNFFGMVFPEPDMKFLVDVDSATAMSRINSRGEVLESFETEEQLSRIRVRIDAFVYDNWFVIDNNGTLEESKMQILMILENSDRMVFHRCTEAGSQTSG